MLTPQLKRLWLTILLLVSMFVALTLTLEPDNVDASDTMQQQGQRERELQDEVPKHVPLKVKIRKEKEKAFKDLDNEQWARDFELEVTNVGDKPIYEFYMYLIFDVKDSSGQNVMAPVYYGRAELGDHRVKATPEDVPLKPGESCVLKIHPGQLEAWDIVRREEGRAHPKKITVKFQLLSFGDGTGLIGPDGRAVPRKSGTPPNLTRSVPPHGRTEPAFDLRVSALSPLRKQVQGLNLPASLLPWDVFLLK